MRKGKKKNFKTIFSFFIHRPAILCLLRWEIGRRKRRRKKIEYFKSKLMCMYKDSNDWVATTALTRSKTTTISKLHKGKTFPPNNIEIRRRLWKFSTDEKWKQPENFTFSNSPFTTIKMKKESPQQHISTKRFRITKMAIKLSIRAFRSFTLRKMWISF